GKSLKELEIRKRTGCNIIGMWASGELSLNPKSTDIIRSNSILLAVGTDEQLIALKKLTR
ncbi:MAG: TrkA C-terminal domain-containing protein, partial [Methanosarcinales archaeon]|nr:TrkA C-terminal domain-containing protein [Methanosarcinales archaeon]